MAYYISQKDYYFGAALSVFFTQNKDAKPSLIESLNSDSRCYEMISDTADYSFCLYMKRKTAYKKQKDNSLSWSFVFSPNEKSKIQEYIKDGKRVFILLLCSEGNYKNTVIAVLTQNEYLSLEHKKSVTVKWEMAPINRKQKFTIPNRGNNSIYIDCNRIERKFTDIQDAI